MANKNAISRSRRQIRLLFTPHPYLRLLEKGVLNWGFSSEQPQLFILGLPRSGTTLVYQYIAHRCQTAYFTNLAGSYYWAPCVITHWQRKNLGRYFSDFQSEYGKVKGALSPREAGAIWGRFFSPDDYESYADISPQKTKTLKKTVFCIQQLFGNLPFINKNVKHMLRIDALSKIFPKASFLVVERDLTQVALSVLRGRYANLNDLHQWWSVKPPNYRELKTLSPPEQVAKQMIALQEKMDADFARLASRRVIRIGYELFCQQPEAIIPHLYQFYPQLGYRNEPVANFPLSENSPETVEEQQLLNIIKPYATPR